MKSPFKFLDPFTTADKDAFLGRDAEVAALYDMVSKNRLMLVYGQSGTGKTSLIQCGLGCRLDATDWYPITVRRGNDLNLSLRERLDAIPDLPRTLNLSDAMQAIYEQFLRPAYLIFDQLEELFVLGSDKEQSQFALSIQSVLDSSVPCRILFVIREEYLAQLYGFERLIPTLFDRRLRVEPMSAAKVKEVLAGSFRQFNIQTEAPADGIYSQIIDSISGGKSGIQLPYLQVYLDMLYRQEFARSHPSANPMTNGAWLPVEITRREVEALGKIEDVLEKFLREQQDLLQQKLKGQFPDIQEDTVKNILDAFVSEEATKRPVGYNWQGDKLMIEKRWASLFLPATPEVLATVCRHLEQARLLRFEESHIELAHDSLAALIDGQRSAQQRRLNEVRNRLRSQYGAFADTQEFLSPRSLNAVEELMPQLAPSLTPELRTFIEKSRAHNESLAQAELAQARKRATIGFALAAAAVLGLLVAVFYFFRAKAEYAKTLRAIIERQKETAQTLKLEGKYAEGIATLNELRQFGNALSTSEWQENQALISTWQRSAHHMNTGDSLARLAQLHAALQAYRQAQASSPDERISGVIKKTEEKIEADFKQLMLQGLAMENANRRAFALINYKNALLLKPDDPDAKAKVARLGE